VLSLHRRRARNQTTTFDQEGNRTYMSKVTIKEIPPAVPQKEVTIVMDEPTAQMLFAILCRVGDSAETSRSKYAQELIGDLRVAGICSHRDDLEGNLHFTEE